MAADINRIRNPDFRQGKKAPNHWNWEVLVGRAAPERLPPIDRGGPYGLRIASTEPASAYLSQEVPCQPGKWYRVEAVAALDLSSDTGGFVLRLSHPSDEEETGTRTIETDPVTRTTSPHTIRAFFLAPEGVRRARLSVGIQSARGTAEVRSVRFMRILEPEYASHPFAAPVPSAEIRPPRVTERVIVCSRTASTRPLTRILSEFFGKPNVSAVDPEKLNCSRLSDGALLLPDSDLPPSIRTLNALWKIAETRCVVVSLAAFARLTRGAATARRILQPDDPTYARVVLGDHATFGFALHDAFAYAAAAGKDGSAYVQNQFRKTEKLTRFCKKHHLVVVLESLCDKDATSYQPVALHRPTGGGGLYVLDVEPAEAEPSSMGEPLLAVQLLLSLLGRTQSQLGQYFTVQRREAAIRESVRELAMRYSSICVHDAELPSSEINEQLVTVGGEEQSFGLPLLPRPVILIRSGLTGGDLESLCGCWLWMKQFVRPLPHACPYGRQLISKFRVAWIPSVAPWSAADGWRRSGRAPLTPTLIDCEPGDMAAVIDVVSRPVNLVRVVFARNDRRCAHAARWLPSLFSAFSPQQRLAFGPPPGASLSDRGAYSWHMSKPSIEVGVAPESFTDPAHADALAAGACVIRIEVPGQDSDWVANSIHRTEVVALLLEQVMGLQYGLIAVNRRPTALHFDGFPLIAAGEALIADHKHPILSGQIPQAG